MFKIVFLLSLWTLTATAQFGFFDQMFGNGGQQQQQQQANVRSDSSWYQAQYESGMFLHILNLTLRSRRLSEKLRSQNQC